MTVIAWELYANKETRQKFQFLLSPSSGQIWQCQINRQLLHMESVKQESRLCPQLTAIKLLKALGNASTCEFDTSKLLQEDLSEDTVTNIYKTWHNPTHKNCTKLQDPYMPPLWTLYNIEKLNQSKLISRPKKKIITN